MTKKINIFNYLVDNCYFTYEELQLVTTAYGFKKETFDIVCYVRYGLNSDQMINTFDDDIELDYNPDF